MASAPGLLVIGAGPAGLSAAFCLRQEGVAFRWVDREGAVGGAYRSVHPGMALASPSRYSSLPGLWLETQGEYVTAGRYREYLEFLAKTHGLSPEKAAVAVIESVGGEFRARFAGGGEGSFSAVVCATGMFDHPRWPAIPGLARPEASEGLEGSGPRVLHARDWKGPEPFKGRRLLIIGAGVSGIELAEECARARLPVALSSRRRKPRTVPQRVLGRDVHDYAVLVERLPVRFFGWFCRRHAPLPGTDLGFWGFVADGRIRLVPQVERFEGGTACYKGGEREGFDAVVCATGYRFEAPYLPSSVERGRAGQPLARAGESPSVPGLYFMGFPCARGLDSEFLRGMARDAPLLARTLRSRQG